MNAECFSMSEPIARLGRIAILWRGDQAARRSATRETSRFKAVFAALADVGVEAEPVVYEDNVLDAVRAQLAKLDGVLVWVNPIHEGRNRAALVARGRGERRVGERPSRCDPQDGHEGGAPSFANDELGLRHGALPDGQRDASRTTGADRGWAARDQAQPRQRRPGRLEDRDVAKPTFPTLVRVLDATKDVSEVLALDDFLKRCIEYFEDGCVIDQEFQARLNEGVV